MKTYIQFVVLTLMVSAALESGTAQPVKLGAASGGQGAAREAAPPATFRGTVKNGTTGKPAGGEEVVLLATSEGGQAVARSRTDAAGRFRLAAPGAQAPFRLRVSHQGVGYLSQVASGGNAGEILVYDAAAQLDGVTATLDIQRMQANAGNLQVVEEITLDNASYPARTLLSPLEIQLPPEAQVLGGAAQVAGGRPVKRAPAAGREKGRYYFPYPLFPGETRYAVAYQLPYRGEAARIEPKFLYPLAKFAVVLPAAMKFEADSAAGFQPVADHTDPNVQMMAVVNPTQTLSFRISGVGMVATAPAATPSAQTGSGSRQVSGGLHGNRWLILGGLTLVLASAVAGFLGYRRRTRGGSAHPHAGRRPAAEKRMVNGT